MIDTFFGETVTCCSIRCNNELVNFTQESVKTKAVLLNVDKYAKVSMNDADELVALYRECNITNMYIVFHELNCLPSEDVIEYLIRSGIEVLMHLTATNYEKASSLVKFIVTAKRDNPCIPFTPFVQALQNNRIFGVHKGIQVTFGLKDVLDLIGMWHDSVKLRID